MGASKFWILGLGLLLVAATVAQAQQVVVLNNPHNVLQLDAVTATAPGTPGVNSRGYDPSYAIDDRISVGVPGTKQFYDEVHFIRFDKTQPYQIDVDLGGSFTLTSLQAYVSAGNTAPLGPPGPYYPFTDADRTVSQVEFFVDTGGGFVSVGSPVLTAETDDVAGFDLTRLDGSWTGVTDVRYRFTLKTGTNPPRVAEVLAISPDVVIPYKPRSGLVLTGGGLALVEEGGTMDADNLATAPGAVAFGTPSLSAAAHSIPHANDGIYGNNNSWLANNADGDGNIFIGIDLPGSELHRIDGVAFGRDNTAAFTDRWQSTYLYGWPVALPTTTIPLVGQYELQYTTVADPNVTTPDANWTTIGTIDASNPGGDTYSQAALRHRYSFDPVSATGLRLLCPYSQATPNTKQQIGTCIDELEVYTAVPEPGSLVLLLGAAAGLLALRRRAG